MHNKPFKEPIYADDEISPSHVWGAIVVTLCILLTILFFTIPEAAISLLILFVVILAPYFFGRQTNDYEDYDDMDNQPDERNPFNFFDP